MQRIRSIQICNLGAAQVIEDARAFINWNLERYNKGEIGEWPLSLKKLEE